MTEIVWDKSKNTYTDEELQDILKQHELWLETDGEDGNLTDLSNTILVNSNFQGANLEGSNFQGANLEGSNFQGANLEGSNFQGANLEGSNFQGAKLEKSYLFETDLTGANFANANLKEANLQEATIREATFQNADLWGADLWGADLWGADFQGANCENAVFVNATINNIKTNNAKLIGAKFFDNSSQDLFLNHNIQEAQQALANSLANADKYIDTHNATAKKIQDKVECLFKIILGIMLFFFIIIFLLILCGNNNFNELLDKLGAWSLMLFSFPIIIILTITITLLRHQKKLLDEVRHYSADKRQIELYSGLLQASQHAAASLNDRQESAKYVQDTFTAIRDRLLSEQMNTNTAGSAVEKEDYGLEPIIKVISDMIAKSEVKK